MFQKILDSYGLSLQEYQVEPFGSGLINHTWKVFNSENIYILQKINTNVFRNPYFIDENLRQLNCYLKDNSTDYLFVSPLPNIDGETLIVLDNEHYRLFPFIKKSHSIDFVTNSNQAYEAAKQFGKFTRMFSDLDAHQLQYTLTDFHNLPLRLIQFNEALKNADSTRLTEAKNEIDELIKHENIAIKYSQLVEEKSLPQRVIHHDTKINNVLLGDDEKGLCVIDLDTVMPGYYISDVGDMMRTYLSQANEEEKNTEKIQVRLDIFTAIYKGYMDEMEDALSEVEKSLFVYSGKFMIYMQALRFLTDFLNNDVYYQTSYSDHNLVRAKNQLALLTKYIHAEDKFNEIIASETLIRKKSISQQNN